MGETPRTEGRRRLWPTFRPLSSVRGRIIAGFGLLVLILAAVVAGSAWQVRAHRSTLAAMEEHTVTASLLEEITVDTMFAGANMEHYILTGDETVFDEIQGSAARSLQNLVEVRSRVEAGGHDELELAIDDITITAFGAGATLDEIIRPAANQRRRRGDRRPGRISPLPQGVLGGPPGGGCHRAPAGGAPAQRGG